MIKKYFDFKKRNETSINENIETEELKAGKHTFNSFLKVISSLGLRDTKPYWDNIPDNMLLFFLYNTEYVSLKDRLLRFPSLSLFIDKLPKIPKLYFGIRNDLYFEFGFYDDHKNELVPIGNFKLNNSSLKYLQLLESPSANHLKKELAFLNLQNLRIISYVAKYIKNYHPGDTEERTFKIEEGILYFGYKSLGEWVNNKPVDFDNIKTGFKTYLGKIKVKNLQMKMIYDDKSYIYCLLKII